MQEVLEFHRVGVVEDPFVAQVELEHFICLADLFDAFLQFAYVGPELARAQNSSDVKEGLCWQLGAISEGPLVGYRVSVHRKLSYAGSLLIREVVHVSNHVLEELHRSDRVCA